MGKRETLKDKAFGLWKKAGLPDFFNKKGPKRTPAWLIYACYLEYTVHAPAWRRAANFMDEYHGDERHWTTWQKAIAKWPSWVWRQLENASIDYYICDTAAVDGTTFTRSDASQHYLHRIDSEDKVGRPVQAIFLVDVIKRKFLSNRVRSKPRGEKCDVPGLVRKAPVKIDLVLMDKGFDSNPLHEWLRCRNIWSVAPVRKGCKRGEYRRQMRDCFDWCLYWQRNIVEALISALKRLFGSHLRAHTARMQRAEVSMRIIAYNIGAMFSLFSTEPMHKCSCCALDHARFSVMLHLTLLPM